MADHEITRALPALEPSAQFVDRVRSTLVEEWTVPSVEVFAPADDPAPPEPRRPHRIAMTLAAAAAVIVVAAGLWTFGSDDRAPSEPVTTATAVSTSLPTIVTEPATTTPLRDTTSATTVSTVSTVPPVGVPLADWIGQQQSAGRTDGEVISGAGTDAQVLVAYPPGAPSVAASGLLLPSAVVIDLPDGISTTRAPALFGLGGQPVIISGLDDGYQMWMLDQVTGTWSDGPDLGVFADPQSVPFVALLDGRLVVANQTVRDSGVSWYVPDRFAGVIVDADLNTTAMAAPPDGQFLWVTSTVGSHALMLGLDSGAGVNAPLTQPWDFDAHTNTWTEVPQPNWLDCGTGCQWTAPHEFGDTHLEVVVDDRVVMRLPDGSIGEYVPDAHTWTRLDDAPFQLASPAVAVLGDQIAIAPMFTGYDANEPGVVGVLDLASGTWTTDRINVDRPPDGSVIATAARTDGTIGLFHIVQQGEGIFDGRSPDFVYDPASRTWRTPTPDDVALWATLSPGPGSTVEPADLLP